ncbi:hypothetical protein BVC80_213g10 [Macleaya cordata]|uniref:Uncharacterized protein n=1 Tax=Macleaya cordata TaxID=56857 RepID=A0A200PUV5_MACCD|nr:hypothetical protein BVC80_213g10 [Macleaya cordata]
MSSSTTSSSELVNQVTVSDGLPLEFDTSINHDKFMASLLHVFSDLIEELIRMIIIKSSPNIQPVNGLIADQIFILLECLHLFLSLSL